MRKVISIKPEIKEGDKLELVHFAFFPKWIYTPTEKTLIWLENYIQCYQAEKVLEPVADAIGPYGCWLAWHNEWVIKWVKTETKLYGTQKAAV